MRHTWKETWSGIRRNASMTVAVIVTMWVSLSLFGAGLLATQQVDIMKGKWYDKIEITVWLCNAENQPTQDPNCDGTDVTDAQKQAIKAALEANPETDKVFFASKQDAYDEFLKVYQGTPIQDTLRVDQMQESYRVKLKNPEQYASVQSSVASMRGVQSVQDLHKILDPFFRWLNLAKWATIAASLLLLLAAALQIANTIRMAAFARRRELGIMRLVGASNLAIMLPFLLESLFAAVCGILLAALTLTAIVYFVIIRKSQVSIQPIGLIGWSQTGIALAWVAVVGVLLSIIPTLFATRRYLRV